MRKIVLILIAFIAVVTFIRAFDYFEDQNVVNADNINVDSALHAVVE